MMTSSKPRIRPAWIVCLFLITLLCGPQIALAVSTDYATGTVSSIDHFPPQKGDSAGVNARWKTVELRRDGVGRYFIGNMQDFAGHNSVTTPSNPIPKINWTDGDFSAVRVGSAFRVRIKDIGQGKALFTVDYFKGSKVDPNQWTAALTFESGLARGSWPWAGTAPAIPNRLVFQRGAGTSSQTVAYWAGSSLPSGGGGPVPHFGNPPQPAMVSIPTGGSHTIEYTDDQPAQMQNIFFSILVDNDQNHPVCSVSAELHKNGEITNAKANGCPKGSAIEVKSYPGHIAVQLPPQIKK